MEIYYTLIFLLLFAILLVSKNFKLDKKIFIFLGIIVIAIVAFRHQTIGMDTMNYLYYFQNPYRGYTDGRTIEEIEPAYTLLNFILYTCSSDNSVFIFVTSLLTMIPIMIGIYKYSPYRVLSLFLFVTAGTLLSFYVYYFSMIRQCLAISCMYLAVYSLIDNKMQFRLRTLLLLIVGLLFHYSSIVALPFFFIYKLNLKPRIYIILLVISILIAISSNIFNLSSYIDLIFAYTGRNLSFYFDTESIDESNFMAFIPTSLIAIAIYIFLDDNSRNNIFIKIYSYGVLINNIFSQLMPTNSDRFVLFYMLALIWVLPLFTRNKNVLSVVRFGLIIVCICYFIYKFNVVLEYYYINSKYINGISPYKSIIF